MHLLNPDSQHERGAVGLKLSLRQLRLEKLSDAIYHCENTSGTA